MKPVIAATAAVLLLSISAAGPTFAATILVPADQPTIQAGIDWAITGDLVSVAPGTYVENIRFHGKAITLKSEAGAGVTTIDGNHSGSVVLFDSWETEETVLDGFLLTKGSGKEETVPYGGGIFCGVDTSPTIRNCRISANSAYFYVIETGRGGGIYCWAGSAPTVESCEISGNSSLYGAGVYCSDSASPTFLNCVISDNTALMTVGGCGAGGGFYAETRSMPSIKNCTIADNHGGCGGGGIYCAFGSGSYIVNSILWGNFASISGHQISGTAAVDFSDVEGGWPGAGNFDDDPDFVGGGDYHLTDGSPCIDAGTDAGVYTDIDGDVRPQCQLIDVLSVAKVLGLLSLEIYVSSRSVLGIL